MRQTGIVTYTPLDGKPTRLTLGLRTLEPAHWIEVDEHRRFELLQKARLLRERHQDVVANLPDGDAGSRECWDLLSGFVVRRFPELYTDVERDVDGRVVALTDTDTGERIDVRELHPIDACGRIVQEDVAIMRKRDGAWVLVAASLCFTSRWKLADKIGKDLSGIHGPVPGYASQIGKPVEVMFDKIDVDRPVWRLNWTLLDDAELHQPEASKHWQHVADELARGTDLGALLHFRVERQTLTKLPLSGDIVFTIRTYVRPLVDLGGPEQFANLAAALRAAAPELVAYKGWGPLMPDALAWLDARVAAPTR